MWNETETEVETSSGVDDREMIILYATDNVLR